MLCWSPPMHVAARTVAALLLAFAAIHGMALFSSAMADGERGCRGSALDGRRCAGYERRPSRGRPAAYAYTSRHAEGRRPPIWGRRKLYAGGESAVRQLSPRLRPRRMSTLRADDPGRSACDEANANRSCRPERNLADAIIQLPNAATAKILRETGIPIIPGVPPIVILRPGGNPWVEDLSGNGP